MKKHACSNLLIGLVTLWRLFAGSEALTAAEPEASVQRTLDKLLAAVVDNDRKAFVAEATDAVKQGVTPEIMEGLAKQLGARLKKGYEAIYLCQLKQQGHQVHLWKMTFTAGGDDIVIRMALKDDKVDGFFLQ